MDKTLAIANWLKHSNEDFTLLKTHDSRSLLTSVMVMAKLFFFSNGPEEIIPHPIAVKDGRVYIPFFEENRNGVEDAEAEFSDRELHDLKTISRRFSYAPPAELAKGLINAEPFCKYAKSSDEVLIDEEEIPVDFILSMQSIKKQYEGYDFNFKAVRVNGRAFFAEPDFELQKGDYEEIVRAMKEGFIEPDRYYRLARDKDGNLMAW